jgi:hypothetical protein
VSAGICSRLIRRADRDRPRLRDLRNGVFRCPQCDGAGIKRRRWDQSGGAAAPHIRPGFPAEYAAAAAGAIEGPWCSRRRLRRPPGRKGPLTPSASGGSRPPTFVSRDRTSHAPAPRRLGRRGSAAFIPRGQKGEQGQKGDEGVSSIQPRAANERCPLVSPPYDGATGGLGS